MACNPKPDRHLFRRKKYKSRIFSKWYEKVKAFKPGMVVRYRGKDVEIDHLWYFWYVSGLGHFEREILPSEVLNKPNWIVSVNVVFKDSYRGFDNIANVDWPRKIEGGK